MNTLELFTLILAFATVGLLIATAELVAESHKSREAAKRPRILVKLKPYEEHGDFMDLVLVNLGKGAAFNVEFSLEDPQGVLAKANVLTKRTEAPIKFIASGETERYSMGASHTLFSDPPPVPFPVVVTYEDVDGKKYTEETTLDVKQFMFLPLPVSSTDWRQMAAMEKIAKVLERVHR